MVYGLCANIKGIMVVRRNELPSHHYAASTALFFFGLLLCRDHWRVPVRVGGQSQRRCVLYLWHGTIAGTCVGPWWFRTLGGLRWLRWFLVLLLAWLDGFLCLGRHRRDIVRIHSQGRKVSIVGIRRPAFFLPLFLQHLLGKGRKHLLVRWKARIRLVHRGQPWRISLGTIDSGGRPGFSSSGGWSLRCVP